MSGNGPEFFQTVMGRAFYERDVPMIGVALVRIANLLDVMKQEHDAEHTSDDALSAQIVTMEEAVESARRARDGIAASLATANEDLAHSQLLLSNANRDTVEALAANAALRRQVERLQSRLGVVAKKGGN